MGVQQAGSVLGSHRDDITVRDNIDTKIASLKQMIEDLEATKAELGPLMDMRIDRLRRAMNGGIY